MACSKSPGSSADSLCHSLDAVHLEASVGLVGFPVLGNLFVTGLAAAALSQGTFAA